VPGWHAEHWLLLALVQVTAPTQPMTGPHAAQVGPKVPASQTEH